VSARAPTAIPPPPPPGRRRLLVVSHSAVVNVNQHLYRELISRGWDLTLVVPSRWRHEYASRPVRPQILPGMESALRPTPIVFPGSRQRHLYLARCSTLLRQAAARVAFVDAEPFSLPAAQWCGACVRLGVPFGVQCAENIDRSLPFPVRRSRARVLRYAAFVAARSAGAAHLARAWGATGEVGLLPFPLPPWESVPASAPLARPFTVGFAGRLVQSKGLDTLLAAVRLLEPPVELLLLGDGPLRSDLEGASIPGGRVRVLPGLRHDDMPAAYGRLDVLALPSRSTPTWKEQFGRVLTEALSCGVPVVGSDSGEIPNLIALTGGGLVFAEGDPRELSARLASLRADPEKRRRLADVGRSAVLRLFSVAVVADELERLLLGALARTSGGS